MESIEKPNLPAATPDSTSPLIDRHEPTRPLTEPHEQPSMSRQSVGHPKPHEQPSMSRHSIGHPKPREQASMNQQSVGHRKPRDLPRSQTNS
jgi:hypothetical protein